MIIDRYLRPENVPAASWNDPILQELAGILEDPELFRLVRQDLARHYKRSKRGPPAVPVEVTLRLVVLRRRKQWSYRQIEQEVRDSPSYRNWVQVYDQRIPDHSTLNDLEHRIRVRTQHQLNEHLLILAQNVHLSVVTSCAWMPVSRTRTSTIRPIVGCWWMGCACRAVG